MSPSKRTGRWLVWAGLPALVFAVRPAEAARHAPPLEMVRDTARPSMNLFDRSLLFSPDYLRRALDSATQRGASASRATEAIPIVVETPSTEGTAAVLARKFDVPVELARKIVDVAISEGIDPELGFRLIRVESRFQPNARGPAGALGLMQLMPSTARRIDRSLASEAEILEPANNLRAGFRYLRRMIDRYDGDVRLGLLAYNRGEHTVDRALRSGRNPENGYSHRVLGTNGRDPYNGRGRFGR